MEIIITKNYEEVSKKAADIYKEHMEKQPQTVLGFATGSTPLGMYEWLIKYHEAGLDFSKVTTFNLDEYIGLAGDHPASYRYFMEEHLFGKVNVPKGSIHVPNGMAENPDEECQAYEERIRKAGGIDLQVLGIGINGHIGFNEPGTPFNTLTHVAELTESTREANARFFSSMDEVPTHAISMGIKSIMHARRIILLANGEHKAEAVAAAVKGPITPELPASVLQLHPNVQFIIDEAAGRLL
ncbi:MAG TPA: glucosamine-6-phosphate deaminase [Firmicutes bacterium]|jgi:glucosamine-6-phosphate deaminase|nr:MAG: glucosamine-6-phosphate deaminase [Peptococcaceae bacterium 1109]HHT72348.1 glucosamine-6-phosphate deaminase [Bacillota bacterium]